MDLSTYSIDALLDALIQLTHKIHAAKLADTQALRLQRNYVRAEIKRRVT